MSVDIDVAAAAGGTRRRVHAAQWGRTPRRRHVAACGPLRM